MQVILLTLTHSKVSVAEEEEGRVRQEMTEGGANSIGL